MKSRLLIAGIMGMWVPYLSLVLPGSHGNPEANPYAGQPGSAYDEKANPPKANGVVTYDPNAPLAEPAPAPMPGDAMQNGTMAPAPGK